MKPLFNVLYCSDGVCDSFNPLSLQDIFIINMGPCLALMKPVRINETSALTPMTSNQARDKLKGMYLKQSNNLKFKHQPWSWSLVEKSYWEKLYKASFCSGFMLIKNDKLSLNSCNFFSYIFVTFSNALPLGCTLLTIVCLYGIIYMQEL